MSEIFHDKEVVCDAGSHATKKLTRVTRWVT